MQNRTIKSLLSSVLRPNTKAKDLTDVTWICRWDTTNLWTNLQKSTKILWSFWCAARPLPFPGRNASKPFSTFTSAAKQAAKVRLTCCSATQTRRANLPKLSRNISTTISTAHTSRWARKTCSIAKAYSSDIVTSTARTNPCATPSVSVCLIRRLNIQT